MKLLRAISKVMDSVKSTSFDEFLAFLAMTIVIVFVFGLAIAIPYVFNDRLIFNDRLMRVDCEVRVSETYQEIPDSLFPDNCSKRILIIESK